jgi:pimeloyl-ACP methyl ester carboxylesterase
MAIVNVDATGSVVPIRHGAVELFVRRLGEKASNPPLIMIHGGPDWDHSYLLRAASELARWREVVLFDLRGCGGSTKALSTNEYQPDLAVEDLTLLLDALGITTFDLLGFSYGGQLAIRFIDTYSGRVRRAVLASTTAYRDVQEALDAWSEYRDRSQGLKVSALLDDPTIDPDAKTAKLANMTASLDIYDLALLPAYRRLLAAVNFSGEWMQGWRDGTLRSALPVLASDRLAESNVPTLIIHGDKDMRFPVSLAVRLHSEVPASSLSVIPGVGHMAQFEAEQEWVSRINDYLSKEPISEPNERR